jgi:hypothetical protein
MKNTLIEAGKQGIKEPISDPLQTKEWASPKLAPEEHAWIEEITGRTLSNEEAQSLLHAAKLTASWDDVFRKRQETISPAK